MKEKIVHVLYLLVGIHCLFANVAQAQSCPDGSAIQNGSAIQSSLNAIAATGGKIPLPCGCWALSQTLVMPSNTALEGAGHCTILYGPNAGTSIIGDYNARRYGIAVRDLTIDGRGPSATQDGYIAIDFRNVSLGRVRDVYIEDVQTGIEITTTSSQNGAYYNVIQDSVIIASNTGIEILEGANENIVRGGKIQSSGAVPTMTTGVWLRNVNNNKIEDVAIEALCRSFSAVSPCSRGVRVDTGAVSTKIVGIRAENIDLGVHLATGSSDTVGLGVYCSVTTTPRKSDVSSYRWIGTGCGTEN